MSDSETRRGGAAIPFCLVAAVLFPSLSLMPAARAAVPPSQASTPAVLKELSLEQLSEIEVTTPSRTPERVSRTPVAVYVITGEDIRRSSAITIPDALRIAPGIEVAQIDSNKWSVGIRGFGTGLSRDVLVLMDGRTVYTPLFAGTYWDVQDTLLEDIDRIEVIRGPGGTIWGPNAVTGVINIITKSSKETRGFFASAGGGNVEQGFANFRYGAGNANGITWRVYGKAFSRGHEYHYDGDNFDSWGGGQGGYRMDWVQRDNVFALQGDLYKHEEGQRVSANTYVPPVNNIADGHEQLSGGNVLFRWTRKFSDRNDFQLQAYYDRTNRHELNFGDRLDTFDLDIQERTRLPWRQQLIYGLEGRVSPGHFLEVVSGLVFSPPNRTDFLVSGFFEDDLTLIDDKLQLSLGSKVLHTNYTGFQTEPSIRLLWTPNVRSTFWAAFTHAVRTPSDAERDFYLSSYLGTEASGTELFARFGANPAFAPEQLNGYELGYRQLIGENIYLDFAGFFNNYHDLFNQEIAGPIYSESTLPFLINTSQPPIHDLYPARFGNSLDGLTTGGEIAPEWRPKPYWRLRGSYSYLNMNLSRARGPIGLGPAGVVGASPRHETDALSSFDLGTKLRLDLIYRYVSALPAVSAPGYSTGDTRIAWQINSHFEFSAAGRNLFQPQHVEYAGDPGLAVAVRRSVYGTLAWTK